MKIGGEQVAILMFSAQCRCVQIYDVNIFEQMYYGMSSNIFDVLKLPPSFKSKLYNHKLHNLCDIRYKSPPTFLCM